uniref:Uncharacterized protein n=1 Tax=Cyprinus carpio TaxID=7962 RepID=A0A8C1PL88_CYPCA
MQKPPNLSEIFLLHEYFYHAPMKITLDNDLCGRTPVQSFIKDSEENIKRICNDLGTETKDGYNKSTNYFQVYNIKSENRTSQMLEWVCNVSCTTAKYYVIVECQNKLPVHYHAHHIEKNKKPRPCYYTA